MSKEFINVTDKKGNPLFKTTKEEAHKRGLLHKIELTLVFNSKGEILLTRAAPDRSDAGTLFHPSGGHIGSEKDTKEGTLRELNPEAVGFLGSFLHRRKIRGIIENHLFFVFRVLWNGPIELSNEAVEYQWFSPSLLKEELKKNPSNFSDPLKISLQRFVFTSFQSPFQN
jgi:isopentenyldiphosphate isomerase